METMTIEIQPIPQPRPRFGRNGGVYESRRIKEYKDEISARARIIMKDKLPLKGNIFLGIKLYSKYPPLAKRYGDVDNHAKAIMDALNGIVYEDDSQVVGLSVEKHFDTKQRVEISWWEQFPWVRVF